MKPVHFYKYQATGNDFVIIDNRQTANRVYPPEFIRFLCHRRFGVGADGFMLLGASSDSSFTMRYFNSNGGESTMCGNGGRCIAAFVTRLGIVPEGVRFEFEAIDGKHYATVENDFVSLKMVDVDGITRLEEGFFLNTGSPHVVVPCDDVSSVNVYDRGKRIRNDKRFEEVGGTNVNFLTIQDHDILGVRTFERGVEDETWSCGTGSVASAMVARFLSGTGDNFNVEVRGGLLKVRFDVTAPGCYRDVWLEGPATFVFEGDTIY